MSRKNLTICDTCGLEDTEVIHYRNGWVNVIITAHDENSSFQPAIKKIKELDYCSKCYLEKFK